jgi:nitrite reductase/ring-hydroxylating ferredoxin subunit
VVATAGICVTACHDSPRKRPFGYIRLGKVSELLNEATLIPQQGMLVRHDERGFFAMSVMCTHDLRVLEKREIDGRLIFVCPHDHSIFDLNGILLKGPAKLHLPYYKLELDAGKYEGPKDTLYCRVGDEVASDWRLAIDVIDTARRE